MKNHRDVCKASDAGFVEYSGLPERIITGCMHSPDYKSRYCKLHKNRVCSISTESDQDSENREGLIEMILEKKVTRTATYYKVKQHNFANKP